MNTGNTRFLYFFANNPRKNPYSGVDFAVDFAVSGCFPPQNPSTRVDFEVDFLFRTSDTSPPENVTLATTNSVPILFQYLKPPIQVLKSTGRKILFIHKKAAS